MKRFFYSLVSVCLLMGLFMSVQNSRRSKLNVLFSGDCKLPISSEWPDVEFMGERSQKVVFPLDQSEVEALIDNSLSPVNSSDYQNKRQGYRDELIWHKQVNYELNGDLYTRYECANNMDGEFGRYWNMRCLYVFQTAAGITNVSVIDLYSYASRYSC